jgi:hypothetical protein
MESSFAKAAALQMAAARWLGKRIGKRLGKRRDRGRRRVGAQAQNAPRRTVKGLHLAVGLLVMSQMDQASSWARCRLAEMKRKKFLDGRQQKSDQFHQAGG